MIQFKRIRCLVSMQRIDVRQVPHLLSLSLSPSLSSSRTKAQEANEQEAVTALEPLSKKAPDEANVFFLLGKCYLRLDRRGEAAFAFTSARDLQPKLEGAIRAAFERSGEEDEEEDDE